MTATPTDTCQVSKAPATTAPNPSHPTPQTARSLAYAPTPTPHLSFTLTHARTHLGVGPELHAAGWVALIRLGRRALVCAHTQVTNTHTHTRAQVTHTNTSHTHMCTSGSLHRHPRHLTKPIPHAPRVTSPHSPAARPPPAPPPSVPAFAPHSLTLPPQARPLPSTTTPFLPSLLAHPGAHPPCRPPACPPPAPAPRARRT